MLTPEDVWHFPVQMWDRVLSKVNRAVVFMDDPCAEILHWSAGGAAALFDAGARNVKQFSSFESCSEDEPKAVFVVSTLLKGRTVDTLKDIISLSRLQYCVVVTAVSHPLHLLANNVTAAADADGAAPVFEQLEDKLCEWMGDMNYTAEVLHVPLSFAPVSQQLLLAPAFARLFPLLPPDLRALNAKRPDKKRFASLLDVDMPALPAELQLEIKALAGALNALFEATGTREESFAVGPMSRLIAGELAAHPQAKNRRKAAPNKASIIFVDRTMDLTGAVGHHGDSLAEKILTVLKPLPGHVTDVQVDMRELTGVLICPGSESCVAPGCLAQTQSPAARSLWEAMLTSKHKEGVMEVRRQLVEAASKEKLPIKMSMGRVTPEQLCSYARPFRGDAGALETHCGVLQLGLATAQTLRHPLLPRWDACLAFERLLLQALGDADFASVLSQMLPLMKPRGGQDDSGGGFAEDECGPDELILLLVYLYSLADEAQHAEREDARPGGKLEKLERELIGGLTLAITRETELSPLLQKLTGCTQVEELSIERVHSVLEHMFETLGGLSHARDHHKQLRRVYTASDGVHQATYQPFLRQILQEVFHPDKHQCPDIEHMSGGLTDLLKTGFSMFMKVSRPHPSDNPLLFLFLVGGVTPSELRLIKETVAALKPGSQPQVLVVSTRLLRPADVPELLFATQRLTPDIGV
ncbi:sec1 family domain-containing protein 2 isoform X1 [Hippocampus comes]|uniref:sec1 family domain-containing protein 2 isoform X1 n=1 Tax=Hippocampus comes TaxID=109280 RepID=UPI00094E2F3B|nr:PREDICTED: sec1 family domain-containing protein 2 isoform X1 [Hippocampus comes]